MRKTSRRCEKGLAGKRRDFTISLCHCPKCKRSFPIPRKRLNPREKGHQKYIWCPYCFKVENMFEIRYNDCYRSMYGNKF